MTKEDYMKLSKEKLAELLVEREKLQQTLVPITTKWYDAQGDHLPPYDKEVIVVIQDYEDDPDHLRVAYGHRPNPNGYANKDGERLYPMTYGIGGWNGKNVKYWLDVELPINND